MASWQFTATSINGRTIVAGSIQAAYFQIANGPLYSRQYAPVSAQITGRAPGDVRGQPQSTTWRLRVSLSAMTEVAKSALRTMFNETEGLVYLRITDGDGIVWRCPVRVTGIEPLNTIQHDVVLFVPDPSWEEDTLNSNTVAGSTASPFNLGPAGVVANAGTRDAQPKITITAKVAKSENSALNDAPYTIRTSWVNRAPNALVNEPVYLLDQSGAAARLVTDTAAAGAVVRRTTNATTLTADPGAAGATIAVTSAAAFNVNGGLAIIQWVTGGTFGTMECISYATFSGLNLTGCVRGLGGTTAQAHAAASAIAACGTMPDGSDVRIEVDGAANQYRNVVAWNSGASDIVANMTADPAITLTLLAAMTAAIPAVGGTIYFAEGNAALDSDGFLKIADEIFHYSGLVGAQGVLIDGRALWGTTAASHAVNVPVYAKPHRVVISLGWANADAAPSQLALRPAIDLPASNNLQQTWGNEASDPNTIYYDPAAPGRPKQWAPNFDSDGNTVSPIMSAPTTKTSLIFKDDVPGDGSPKINNFEIPIPQGIKAGDVNAWQSTWASVLNIINLEKFTRDGGGVKKLQDQLQTGAAPANRALPVALAATAYAAILKGRYNVITGIYSSNGGVTAVPNTVVGFNTDGAVAQRIVISQGSRLKALTFRAALVSGVTPVTLSMSCVRDINGLPSTVSADLIFQGTVSVTSTVEAEYSISASGLPAPAGIFWFIFWNNAGAVSVNLRLGLTGYANGRPAIKTAGVWVIQNSLGNYQFLLLTNYNNDNTAPIEAEQPVVTNALARTGITASSDKDIIILEPLQTVYVHRNGAFVTNGGAGAMYHLKETIVCSASGESISLDLWMAANSTLVIDFGAGTMTYTEDTIAYPILSLLGSSKLSLALRPGNNTVTVTDVSLIAPGSLDHKIEWRGVRT